MDNESVMNDPEVLHLFSQINSNRNIYINKNY